MSRQVIIEFPGELPEEVLHDPEILKEGKITIVLEMLRRGTISQGRAAELLEIDRQALFDLMGAYHIPVIETTENEPREGLSEPLGPAGSGTPEEDPTTATSGAWKGLLDCKEFEKEVYESRLHRTRPEVCL
jgi:hypothetical protein